MNGQNEKVNIAIEKYRSLCPPDENRELLMLYTQQIQNIKDAVNAKPTDPAELLKVNNLLLSLPDINKARRELARSVGMEEELGKIEEEVKKNRSTLDKVNSEQLKARMDETE
jgi:DNA mismatch repair ATPase MutS